MHTNFEWVQGQGYKDYIKDFDGEIAYRLNGKKYCIKSFDKMK